MDDKLREEILDKVQGFYWDTKQTYTITTLRLYPYLEDSIEEIKFYDKHFDLFRKLYESDKLKKIEYWLKLIFWQAYYQENKKQIIKEANKCRRNKQIRKEVMIKCNNKCSKCGTTKKLSIDHIIPISKGGTNEISNLQILCCSCNAKKSNKVE